MTQHLRCSMTIQSSPVDDAYVVALPEWDNRVLDPVMLGDTDEDALRHRHEERRALVALATKRQEPLPEPRFFAAVRRA